MHKLFLFSATAAQLLGSSAAAPYFPAITSRDASNITSSAKRAAAVHEAFSFAWDGYYQYAFPHDELEPISKGNQDTLGGWGASAVDALTTACVMQDADVVNTILQYIPTINFNEANSDQYISLFETTIRYIGGMVSAYDLLTGPLSHLPNSTDNVNSLLKQAQSLADKMSYAFDTPTGLPSNNLNFTNDSTDGGDTNSLATAGSLVLEWTRLSDLTGNKSYANLTQTAQKLLLNPSSEVWPGLLGGNLYITNGSFQTDSGGWVAGSDSFYEYLIKMFVYDQSRFTEYKERWIAAAKSSMQYLASSPASRPEVTWLAEFNGQTPSNNSQHLACFDGGNFILAGNVLNQQEYIDFGLKLVDGCHETYNSTATQIGPDSWSWDTSSIPSDQQDFYNQYGYYIPDGGAVYDLRPEVMESYYYAYQQTGDKKYQDWAWDAFVAINATSRVGVGFAEANNVNVEGGGNYTDFQESFFFAELMKYSYLIHADDGIFNFNKDDSTTWVFNTEAHPVKIAGKTFSSN